MRRAAILVFAAGVGLCATAVAKPLQVMVRDAVVRPAAAGQPMTGAYMTLVNPTASPIRLTGVACACAGTVSMHQSAMVDGVMQMRPAAAVVVPAHGSVSFQPGGLHLMVMDLKRPIPAGDHVSMRLSFDRGRPVTTDFMAAR